MPLTSIALVAVATAVAAPSVAAASAPPPGRAFEMVSPVDDPGGTPAGVDVDGRPFPGLASSGDDRVIYGAASPVGAYESGASNPLIFGKRTPSGWTAITGMRTTDGGQTALGISFSEMVKAWGNDEGTAAVFMVGQSLGPPHPNTSGQVLQAVYRVGELGVPSWLSGPALGAELNTVSLLQESVASRDLRTVAFQVSEPLVPNGPPAGQNGVYVSRDGQVELASVLPNGDVPAEAAYLANPSGTVATNQGSPPALTLRNVLTRDGRFLVFRVAAVGGVALYVRDLEAGVTHELAPPSGPARQFLGGGGSWSATLTAAPLGISVQDGFTSVASDAPVAFFRSAANLAEGASGTASNKVYEANLETGALTYRSQIDGPPVELSADGRKVMFLRPTAGSADPWQLRLWDADDPDSSTLVGTIGSAYRITGMVRSFRTSADGRTWVFTAADSLDPEHPIAGGNGLQVYRWQIGDPHPTCLSCDPVDDQARPIGAYLSQGEANNVETIRFPNGTSSLRKSAISQRSRAISDDGRLVGFDSPDRLVPEDTDSVRDVYLWDADAPEGEQLQLLTVGTGLQPSYYVDISPDGTNVFFTTQDGLVPADKDLAYDVYVARRGGGFPAPEEPCSGEECRPPGATPPAGLPNIGSITVDGDGNAPPVRASVGVLKVKAVTGWAARLKVRVPEAGRISVAGASIRRTGISASKAGSYTVRIALSSKARRSLKQKKALKVRARVAYRAKDGQSASKTISVTFKQPKTKRAKDKQGSKSSAFAGKGR